MVAAPGRAESCLVVALSASSRSAGAEARAQRPPRLTLPLTAAARRACVATNPLDHVPR